MKIGIFAGTFDPVHKGHLALARAAKEKAGLDEVVLLVEPKPRAKNGVTPLEHRLEMAKLSANNIEYLNVLSIEDNTFTTEKTLPKIQEKFAGAELVLIMGSDVFAGLHRWPNAALLTEAAKFVVSIRHGQDESEIDDASLDTGAEFMLVENNQPKVSSSQIRQDFENLSDYLEPEVAEYVRQHGLYRTVSSLK